MPGVEREQAKKGEQAVIAIENGHKLNPRADDTPASRALGHTPPRLTFRSYITGFLVLPLAISSRSTLFIPTLSNDLGFSAPTTIAKTCALHLQKAERRRLFSYSPFGSLEILISLRASLCITRSKHLVHLTIVAIALQLCSPAPLAGFTGL
ncbi:hypothetical protein CCUS01_11211 [Colletotrichum cuscutae]|uniref:Uncharacterized protein n=1 Tax=Colletotrichum cuscutae TaxID=1209917 RepID=A0AAI9U3J8_9PEZI|nr:hypothetical protein CCUS01_11211 [Colletotrichum cuscutae]